MQETKETVNDVFQRATLPTKQGWIFTIVGMQKKKK